MKLTKIALKQKTATTEAMGVVYEQLFFDGFCFRQGLNLRTSGYEPDESFNNKPKNSMVLLNGSIQSDGMLLQCCHKT